MQAIKAKEVKFSLFLIGGLLGGTWMQMSFFNSRAQRFDAQCWTTPDAWCTPFKQHWKQNVYDYKWHSITMVMVYHKRESIGNGVSWELSTDKEKKQKKTKASVSICKCCMKL